MENEKLIEIIKNHKEKIGIPGPDDEYYKGYISALDSILLILTHKQ